MNGPHAVAHHHVDAAAHEHAAALQVDGAHGEAEEHDAQHEPRRGLADRLLRDAADVEHRGGQVAQHDGGAAPEGDEGKGDRGGDYDFRGLRRLAGFRRHTGLFPRGSNGLFYDHGRARDTSEAALARSIVARLRAARRARPIWSAAACATSCWAASRRTTTSPPTRLRTQILRLFPDARQVGAHFGVMLVRRDGAEVEVATFRSEHSYDDGRHPEPGAVRDRSAPGRAAPRLHHQRPAPGPRDRRGARFRGRPRGPRRPADPRHRRPRGALRRGPPAAAAGGALRGGARVRDRAGDHGAPSAAWRS